eukprot:m.124918 g.124918  ORF g.124918 m.124918 type:complete len:198 (-) comp17307_c0_seq3:90-683(-)
MSAPWSAALQRFLDTKDISNAIATCEDLELKGDASPELISLLITLYLIDGATENAVFLWKRTPLAVRQASQGTIDALHTLTTAIVQHPLAVPTLATLSFPDYLRGIADILQDVMRQKSLALLLKSYSVIQLNDIATALCISREQALEGCASWGWVHDAATDACTRQEHAGGGRETVAAGNAQSSLQRLTSVIKILER